MRIGIDGRFTEASQMGTGSYAETALRELLAVLSNDDEVIVWSGPQGLPRDCARRVRQERLPIVGMGQVPQEHESQLWALALERSRVEIFWSPTGITPVVAPCPTVVSIHDTYFLDHPDWFGHALQQQLAAEIPRSARQATRVIAISEHTRQSILRHQWAPADRIQVITQGVNIRYHEIPSEMARAAHLAALHISQPYLLLLSNHSPHKNSSFALDVMAAWRQRHPNHPLQFVIAGGGPAPQQPINIDACIRDRGLTSSCQIVGRVTASMLPSLYAGATGLLCPSLGEGWGLPPVEAMMMGVPSIVSDAGAHPESMGSVGTVLPLDVSQWLTALELLVLEGPSPQQLHTMQERRDHLRQHSGHELLSCLRTCATEACQTLTPTQAVDRPLDAHTYVQTQAKTQPTHRLTTNPAIPTRPGLQIRSAGISGCTIIRNGVHLNYPFRQSIASYAALCDELILCWDPTSDDTTRSLVEDLAKEYSTIQLIESTWDMQNRTAGSELAKQTQIAFHHCRKAWTLYVQADEAIHEADHGRIRSLIADDTIGAIGFERRSFLGTLDCEITEHHVAGLLRIFRTGTGQSVGDAMQCMVETQGLRVIPDAGRMFNYSRMGSSIDIQRRTTNLHRFYHEDTDLPTEHLTKTLPTRLYTGTHPASIEKHYRVQDIPTPATTHENMRGCIKETPLRVLYCADWHSPSGFGVAARRQAQALTLAGVDVARELAEHDTQQVRVGLLPGRVATIQDNESMDVVIHHGSPDSFQHRPARYNIAFFVWETSAIPADDRHGHRYNWKAALEKHDEIWTACQATKESLIRSGIRTPCHVIGHPVDTEFWKPGPSQLSRVNLPSGFDVSWTVFLYIGTWDERKRPDDVMGAYLNAFHDTDHTLLIIKISKTTDECHTDAARATWERLCAALEIPLQAAPAMTMVDDHLSEEEIRSLYRAAHAFVTATRGEGFGQCAVEAMACGVPLIATQASAMSEYLSDKSGYPIPSHAEALTDHGRFPWFRSDQQWAIPDLNAMTQAMRQVHAHRQSAREKGTSGRLLIQKKYAPAYVGNEMRRQLDRIITQRSSSAQAKTNISSLQMVDMGTHSIAGERPRSSINASVNDHVARRSLTQMNPISQSRGPDDYPTLAILFGNGEGANALPFLWQFVAWPGDMVIMNDSTDGGITEIQRLFAQFRIPQQHIQIVNRPLDFNFAAARNFAHQLAHGRWVLHADLDERWDVAFLSNIPRLIRQLDQDGKRVCGFPRANFLNGTLVNDLPDTHWTEEILALSKPVWPPKNHDVQYRLLIREESWINPLHERPRACQNDPKCVVSINVTWIYHAKDLKRQQLQQSFYQSIKNPVKNIHSHISDLSRARQ